MEGESTRAREENMAICVEKEEISESQKCHEVNTVIRIIKDTFQGPQLSWGIGTSILEIGSTV